MAKLLTVKDEDVDKTVRITTKGSKYILCLNRFEHQTIIQVLRYMMDAAEAVGNYDDIDDYYNLLQQIK